MNNKPKVQQIWHKWSSYCFNILSATAKVIPCVSGMMADISSSTGEYVKTACILKPARVHPKTYAMCTNAGMHLFVIDTAEAQTQLFSMLATYYPAPKGPTLWVDGVKDADGNWYYSSYGSKVSAYTGLQWRSSASLASGCLMATVLKGIWAVDGFPCTTFSFQVCEFKKWILYKFNIFDKH